MFTVLLQLQGHRLADVRNRAILSFDIVSAMQRSELVALDVADIQVEQRGVRVTIRRSKTDQTGGLEPFASRNTDRSSFTSRP